MINKGNIEGRNAYRNKVLFVCGNSSISRSEKVENKSEKSLPKICPTDTHAKRGQRHQTLSFHVSEYKGKQWRLNTKAPVREKLAYRKSDICPITWVDLALLPPKTPSLLRRSLIIS